MKKMIFLMLVFFLGISAGTNAQVVIGHVLSGDDGPATGSILDLRSDGSTPGGKLGLLLPSVTLTDASLWAPLESSQTDAVEGMTVFNSSDALTNGLTGKGIYVWSNNSWNRLGASAIACEAVNGSASRNGSFTGDIGAGQTLEVTLSAGSAPYNYTWKQGSSVVHTTTNSSSYTDSYLATAYGSYTCEITNACTNVPKVINFELSELDPSQYPDTPPNGITVGLGGTLCFDIRSPLTTVTYDYPLNISGEKSVDKVTWVISDANTIQNAPAITDKTNAQLTFKPQTTGQILLTAYIELTKSDNSTAKVSISKVIKFQMAACCAGYIAEQGAYTGTIPSSVASGLTVDQTLALFPSATKKTLCVGPDLGASLTWNAVTANGWCNTAVHNAGGDWNDGNNDWRIPNIAELANLQAVKSSITGLATSNYYWSSTDYSTNPTGAAIWYFTGSGNTADGNKTYGNSVIYTRCVRTMD
jgi:hypothetical protein